MKKGSIIFAGVFTLICMLAVVALSIFAMPIADWYVDWRNIDPLLKTVIPVAFWICAVPALAALACLLVLLRNILKEHIFEEINSRMMSIICWCCVAVAAVTAIGTYWYMPFSFVAAAMLFLCLIVSVVRGCFKAAITLREENDLTI